MVGINAEKVEDLFFFIAAIAARINANSGEFASFTPTFDGKRGNAEDFSYFTNGK